MTARERFLETMRYGKPDRVPLFEEGIRDGVLERWRAQGLPPGADLSRVVRADRRERVPVDLSPRPALPGAALSCSDLQVLRRHLDPEDPERLPWDWQARVAAWRRRTHVLELPIHQGFFLTMGADDWPRVEQALIQLHDDPRRVRAVLDIFSEFTVGLVERILRDVEVDCASFSEPIGGSDRPLMSPRAYQECVLATYRPIIEMLRRRGVGTIIFLTYANTRALLPGVIAAGFNCLWACEAHPEAMDYRAIRREFGKGLRLIGGIDLDTLRKGKKAIRREMEANVPPLLADGGYIPLADGRVRADVPYRNYVYYRRLLARMTRP